MIDLRSDTVTRPTPDMLNMMMSAETGDDVYREDPSVNRLEKKIASLFGMEAGLFVPSGTMSNQLAISILTEPGDEVIIDQSGHLYNYETGATAHLSSVQIRPVPGKSGKITPELIQDAIRPTDHWDPHSRVVAIENSTNKGGGTCYRAAEMRAVKRAAETHGLRLHIDGARIWNALVATGIKPEWIGSVADTLSVCFSKGLGAPVGSMLLSTEARIERARRYRKMWGGGMRQAGILAAAAEYAVDYHWEGMKKDHQRARHFAVEVAAMSGFSIDPESVETNIVLFDVEGREVGDVIRYLSENGVGMIPFGPRTIRATFHFQVDDPGLEKAIRLLREFSDSK
ncbi:MAG: GntG family PLP-dependent aldolase [Balneolaceae bacterium]